jgi:hypothetical protein
MADELTRFFAAARDDADATPLPGAAVARRTGTRRRRIRIGAVSLVAVLAVAAVTAGVNRTMTHVAPLPPAQSVPAVPSAEPPSPVPSSPDPGGSLPDGTAQPCGTDPAKCQPPGVSWYDEQLPAPCLTTTHPSDASIVKREAWASYLDPDPARGWGTTGVSWTLTRYRDGGAGRYLAEVRSAVARCPSVTRDESSPPGRLTLRYRQAGTGVAGDESILLSRTVPYQREFSEGPRTEESTYPIVLVRVGDVVVVVYDRGWESSESPRERFDAVVAAAVAAARAGRP